ncbi:lytic transglycosylase domain-containing protein [Oryzihumus leptocrescens]|uniref:Membrane-bound lytic murein transglycosylase B n=1 Tax=Oryzihumus leptocrescens TaxID=297536 RepID=A0A542ZEV3_9MICO|nr:lytic murein transglycosylase [Oryzihumus leptocrescens]TQL58873.1 membrane-bound lytic murein transglycosylase B [Oryzihumus leptocrescens]
MSKHGQARTVMIPWRRIWAAAPAVALIGGGVALAALGHAPDSASAANTSGALVKVPEFIMEDAGSPPIAPSRVAKGLGIRPGTTSTSTEAVVIDRSGVPARALSAYRSAEHLMRTADPSCHLDWPVLAAIGKVESDHGRYGGSSLNDQGIATPGIYGIELDGTHGTERVKDTDSGLYDQDGIWDRAVGPMQFIPSTWRAIGTDADADGFKNPQSIEDAATTTAAYLCAGRVDLRQSSDLYGSLLRYNNSDSYVRTVEALAEAYRSDVNEVPASFLPAAFADQPQGPPKPGQKPSNKPHIPPVGTSHASTSPDSPTSTTRKPGTPSSSTTSPSDTPSSPSPSTSPSSGGGGWPPILGSGPGSTNTTASVSPTSIPTTVSDLPLSAPAAGCASQLDVSLCSPV